MAARPEVTVYSSKDAAATKTKIALPEVFLAPIRPDVVRTVHRDMAKNARQAYGVYRRAGHQASAESWGTGRAVARIPRASGGGTHRSGQGAYGNQCRGGHMFGMTKTWRRWHRRINRDQRRYATASALAASALPSLVTARGHKIDDVPEIPLVVDNNVSKFQRTKDAVALLQKIEAQDDLDKVDLSEHIRAGKGKWRNRRYISRRGPLVVFADSDGVRAFNNINGVDTANVNSLNLLQLAPGGHVGRFCIWTQAAFSALPQIFGGFDTQSKTKRNYTLPRHTLSNSDVTRVINSPEVQQACRDRKRNAQKNVLRRNPLRNKSALVKLNPNAKVTKNGAAKAKVQARANARRLARQAVAARAAAVKKQNAKRK